MLNLKEFLAARELYYVGPGETITHAAKLMKEKNIGALCVLEESRLVGILSERDMMTRVIAAGRDPATTKVGEVMTTQPVVVQAGESRSECLGVMKKAGIRHLPVVEGGRLLGMVSLRDLLQADLDQKEHEIRLMQDYIQYIPPTA